MQQLSFAVGMSFGNSDSRVGLKLREPPSTCSRASFSPTWIICPMLFPYHDKISSVSLGYNVLKWLPSICLSNLVCVLVHYLSFLQYKGGLQVFGVFLENLEFLKEMQLLFLDLFFQNIFQFRLYSSGNELPFLFFKGVQK